LILLNKRYLVGNKTEKDLLHKFVDIDNKRYASNPNYEEQLLGIYNRMNENTDIVEKLNEFNKYKTILER
jgi:flagellum-specific peptidoglycan hydrolase FlgJ